jgi:hypothetical protein
MNIAVLKKCNHASMKTVGAGIVLGRREIDLARFPHGIVLAACENALRKMAWQKLCGMTKAGIHFVSKRYKATPQICENMAMKCRFMLCNRLHAMRQKI